MLSSGIYPDCVAQKLPDKLLSYLSKLDDKKYDHPTFYQKLEPLKKNLDVRLEEAKQIQSLINNDNEKGMELVLVLGIVK